MFSRSKDMNTKEGLENPENGEDRKSPVEFTDTIHDSKCNPHKEEAANREGDES